MPKAVWGAGDNMLTADDINSAEQAETRKRYSGELPPAGTYRFIIQSLKKGESEAGNAKVVVMATLDGTWQPNHKKFDGAPVFQHLALTKANAVQVRNFLDAIGATAEDLLNKSVVDENDRITKLGATVGDPSGLMVYINVQHSKTSDKYPNKRLEVMYAGYLPVTDDEGDEDTAGAPDDAADEGDAPF